MALDLVMVPSRQSLSRCTSVCKSARTVFLGRKASGSRHQATSCRALSKTRRFSFWIQSHNPGRRLFKVPPFCEGKVASRLLASCPLPGAVRRRVAHSPSSRATDLLKGFSGGAASRSTASAAPAGSVKKSRLQARAQEERLLRPKPQCRT